MPSLFKQKSVEMLRWRREQVEREIAGLIRFRERIDRRIAHLQDAPTPISGDKGWRCTACGRSYRGCVEQGQCGNAPMEPIP